MQGTHDGPPNVVSTGSLPTDLCAGTKVFLGGTNLLGSCVSIGSASTNIVLAPGDGQTSFLVPDGAVQGVGRFVITNERGSFTNSYDTIVHPGHAPTVVAFAPTSGPASAAITITGRYLTGATVQLNSTTTAAILPATETASSDTSLTFTLEDPSKAPRGSEWSLLVSLPTCRDSGETTQVFRVE